MLASCGGSGTGPPAQSGPTPATSCVAPERPTSGATVHAERVFGTAAGLFEPIKILQAPGDPARWFVVQKGGQIKVFDTANPAGVRTWLDLGNRVVSNGESGLLGLAFHPAFPATPEVFVFYSSAGSPLISRLSRLILNDASAPTAFTEQILLTINQPSIPHHGGDIAFGPDGYLYAGLGDGEPPVGTRPPPAKALAGAMLRIDVVGVRWPAPGYNIPGDNPFAANPRCGPASNSRECPEIFAWGFRNPFRWSFDPETAALWLGDVGEFSYEEINQISNGRNYGWPCREGLHSFDTTQNCGTNLVDPVAEYDHSQGDSAIVGGVVYRGNLLAGLRGQYLFSDFVSGRIFALDDNGSGGFALRVIADTTMNIATMTTGADGEVYVADNAVTDAGIYKLVAGPGATADTIPENLKDTGCVDPANPAEPVAGMIPYEVNAPFWSDGASKSRYLALPAGATIQVDPISGHWDLPPGSVLLKRFKRDDRLVETRLLMRHPDGTWAGYTYQWNDAATVATRVTGGTTAEFNGQAWTYPSEGQCMRCHTAAAGFSLGLKTPQLNRELGAAPSTNQLTALAEQGLLSAPLPAAPNLLPRLPDPADPSATISDRARAYLDTNCSQCHRPGGPTPSGMDLRFETPLAQAGFCDVAPGSGDLGISNSRLVAPGSASRSVLSQRMNRRDSFQMPPLGTNLADAGGTALIDAWINSLASCN